MVIRFYLDYLFMISQLSTLFANAFTLLNLIVGNHCLLAHAGFRRFFVSNSLGTKTGFLTKYINNIKYVLFYRYKENKLDLIKVFIYTSTIGYTTASLLEA